MRREATFGSFSIRIRLQEVLFLATRSLSTVVPNVIDTGTLPGLGLVVFPFPFNFAGLPPCIFVESGRVIEFGCHTLEDPGLR